MNAEHEYDVALSFAGEDRAYVEMVADQLKARGVSVFYDMDKKSDLWGKDLFVHLTDVYHKKAKHTVMFCSRFYAEKPWTSQERRAAQARALMDSGYIWPAKFDDTDIPGLLPTTAFIDLRTHAPIEVALLICQKLGIEPLKLKADQTASPLSPVFEGEVSFNYSNHNGKYRIGSGLCEFETCWNKSSRTNIQCLNDRVRGVAVAPKGSRVEDLSDVSKLDFTTRNRRPEIGQFVVLQNHQDVYALLKVLEIQDDSRGDNQDLLRFRYWIRQNGSADFSMVSDA